MSHHEPTFCVDAPDDDKTVDQIVEFYLHNGYIREDGAENEEIKLRRGKSGAGWWSSEMTRLATVVDIRRGDEAFRIDYRIETTGQHMSDDDRDFWRREVDALRSAVADGQLVDLRPDEKQRADELKTELRTTAGWAMAIVIAIIVAATFVADRFGYI